MAFIGQVERTDINPRSGNAVDNALGDIPEIEGQVLRDKEGLIMRLCVVETDRNGTVGEDMGVVFVAGIVKCGGDLDSEREDTSDDLSGGGLPSGKWDTGR